MKRIYKMKKWSRLKVFGIVIISLALPFFVLLALIDQNYRSRAPGAATLTITPSTQTVNPGVSGNLNVFLNPQGEMVNGVELYISYPSALVEVTDLVPGAFFTDNESLIGQPQVIKKNISGGIIHYAVAFPLGSQFGSSAAKNAVTIKYTTKSLGTAHFNFTTSGLIKTTVSGPNAQDVTGAITGAYIIVAFKNL